MDAKKSYEELRILSEKQLRDLSPLAIDLSRKNVDFISTLGVTSGTIASFSLLALQLSTTIKVDIHLLLLGFIVLLVNVFICVLLSRLWIDYEEKAIKGNMRLLSLTQEASLILREDPTFSKQESVDRFNEIKNEVNNNIVSDKTKKINADKLDKWFGRLFYVVLIVFLVGISLIVSSTIGNFLKK